MVSYCQSWLLACSPLAHEQAIRLEAPVFSDFATLQVCIHEDAHAATVSCGPNGYFAVLRQDSVLSQPLP